MSARPTDTEALNTLRDILKPGTTVYTILRHRSSSGMSRVISVHIIENNKVRDLSWLVSRVTDFKLDNDHDGLKVGGAGMDMGYHVVYTLSRILYPEGFKCTGSDGYTEYPSEANGYRGKESKVPACPSNDHTNDHTLAYSRRLKHRDGGYALKHAWI